MTNYNITITGSSKIEITNGDNKLDNLKLSYHRDKIPRFEFSFTDRNNEFSNISMGDEVYLSIDGINKFKGYFEDYSISWAGREKYSMICIGRKKDPYRYYTDRDQTYSGYTNDIASSLADDYIPASFNYSFAFRPEVASSNTGVKLTTYNTQGKTVGACYDELTRNDGFYWDIDNNNIKWFEPSGGASNYAKTFTHSDTSGVNPSNLGKNLNDNINYIKIIGGRGYVGQDLVQGDDNYIRGGPSFTQIFSSSAYYNYIDRIKFKAESIASGNQAEISIMPLFTNKISTYDNISSNNLTSVADYTDEDETTFDSVTISPHDDEELRFNWKKRRNIYGMYFAGGYYVRNFAWQFEYWNDESSDWNLFESGVGKRERWFGNVHQRSIQTSSLKLTISNFSDYDLNFKLYEFASMEKEWQGNHYNLIGEPLSNATKLYEFTTDLNTEWSDWISFDNMIDISQYSYLALNINPKDCYFTVRDTAKDWDGQLVVGHSNHPGNFWNPGGKDYQLTFKIGWGDKIIFTSSQSVSRESERIPTIIRNQDIGNISIAKEIADGILTHSTIEFKGGLPMKGDSNINIYEKISGSINPLGIDQEFEVAGYTDTINKKGYRTKVEVNKEAYDITSKVERIIAKAKTGEFSDT